MMRCLLDLETVPLDNAADYVDLASFTAPSTYKDPLKIQAYIEDARLKALDGLSLDPDLCRIVTVGLWREGHPAPGVLLATTEHEEADLLYATWEFLKSHETAETQIVAYNGVGFDVPVLLRRSLYLGVKAPRIEIGKYRHPNILDPMLLLSFEGALKFRGQAWYCKRFGWVEPPEWTTPDITGADVAARVAAGDTASVLEHCRRDLHRLKFLAEKVGYFTPAVAEVL